MKARITACVLFLVSGITVADMGSISLTRGLQILEPSQKAIISWNGKKEILILSTDLFASSDTKVLEVMPFPAEPKVCEGNMEAFEKAVYYINTKSPLIPSN